MHYQIAIVVPGLPFDGGSLDEKSLGGSETAGLCMARELAALGHEVFVFANCEPGKYDGVVYNRLEFFSQFRALPHDITIVQRWPELFSHICNSKLQILWCHDMAMSQSRQSFCGVLWNVDKVFLLSEYHKKQYQACYGLQEDSVFLTRNGIDLSLFGGDTKRDYKTIVYAARPERGLDNLLDRILPKLISIDPEYKLVLAGYENPVEKQQDFALRNYYDYCSHRAKALGDHVVIAGHLPKADLYRLYQSCGAYVYPTPSRIVPQFREISCISAIEAQAAGLPFITSDRGALPETLAGGSSILVPGDPWTKEYSDLFVDAILDVTACPNLHDKMGQCGKLKAQDYAWPDIAKEWDQFFDGYFESVSKDKDRLARHFIKHSDAKAALMCDGASAGVKCLADERYAHMFDTQLFDDFHEWSSSRMKWAERQDAVGTSRYLAVKEFLDRTPGYKVLDYGCAYGHYTIPLAKEFPERQFVGADISPFCVNACKNWPDSSVARFILASERNLPKEKFDIIICAETLEHTQDPIVLIDGLERLVNPGGSIYFTVPWGPWEFDTDCTPLFKLKRTGDYNPYHGWLSNHLWEFDAHDISDLFGGKQDLDISGITAGMSMATNEYLGWWLISYKPSADRKTGRIDYKRKMRLQRPSETLSVNILGGPDCVKTLEWCLEPLYAIADEILIADCGISKDPVALDIASRYGCHIIPASNPIEHGFETPRNELLNESVMDWVLWIDTDERLINPERLKRYLRPNGYNGYSIRQHHKAVDAEFKPDMPVRLFRNKPYNGKSMRFFGMIHEHAELSLNEGPGPIIVLGDVSIFHVGYECESARKVRFIRNLPLMRRDREKYPERVLGKHFQCRDNILLAKQHLEANGGRVDDYVRGLCEDTIDLYKREFLGQPSYINIDTAEYYSDALRLLGRGVDVAFGVKGSPDGQLEGRVMRFESSDDLNKELSWRAKQEVELSLPDDKVDF